MGKCGGCKKEKPCKCKEEKKCSPKKRSDCRRFCDVVAPAGSCQCAPTQVIKCDIRCDTTLSGRVIIAKEVHVRRGARLRLEPNTEVLFRNGVLDDVEEGALPFASLVVDSGASIVARDVDFKNEIDVQNNAGGLIVVGTNAASVTEFGAQFGAYSSVTANPSVDSRRSRLHNVRFSNLGNDAAGIAALTLFQTLGDDEVSLRSIYSSNAGFAGIAFYAGTFTLDYLNVNNALGNAVLLDFDANVTVSDELVVLGAVQSAAVNLAGAVGSTNRLAVAVDGYITMYATRFADQASNVSFTYTTQGLFPLPGNVTLPVQISQAVVGVETFAQVVAS